MSARDGSAPVIEAEGLAKAYLIGRAESRYETLMSTALSWLRAPARNWRTLRRLGAAERAGEDAEDVLWALRDVSFSVERGEVLGIVGRNGAGKSTLLKLLSRISEPTRGRAVIRGRVASLLEVGTGFHPELTGRENVYMNGTILGMTAREVAARFDQIVEFAGVRRFIDTPVKRYSSGMQLRLAFAVAAHLDPEILIVDEVLAVGDMEFQARCIGRMGELCERGRTVLFVSHNLPAVRRMCTRALLLESGRVACVGPVGEVLEAYTRTASQAGSLWRAEAAPAGRSHVESVRICDEAGRPLEGGTTLSPICIEVRGHIEDAHPGNRLAVALHDAEGRPVFASRPGDAGVPEPVQAGSFAYRMLVPGGLLMPQTYAVTVALYVDGYESLDHQREILRFPVAADGAAGVADLRRWGVLQIACPWSRVRA